VSKIYNFSILMGYPKEMSQPTLNRRQFLKVLAGVAVTSVVGVSLWGTYRTQVITQRLPIVALKRPLRLTLLSDLHAGPFIPRSLIAQWVQLALDTEPDVIVLAGDIFDQLFFGNQGEIITTLSELRAPLGVYLVWGNHDYLRYGAIPPPEQPESHRIQLYELRDAFAAVEIQLLANRGALLRDDIYLMGLDEFRIGAASVMVVHNPDAIPEIPGTVDLVLSGHTHGGQVVLPGVGPLVTSSEYGTRFAQGWVEAPMPAYVTRGLGVTSLPVRFNCPPELTVFDLVPR
jgi:uncharacterized protein